MASRLYKDAAEILSRMEKKQGSLKSLVFSQTFSVSKKKVYALVCQTLKCKAAQTIDMMLHVVYRIDYTQEWVMHLCNPHVCGYPEARPSLKG